MSKVFNRDVELAVSARLTKNGSEIIDADGNITAPIEFTGTDSIKDANGKKILAFSGTASAVNYATVANAKTNNNVTITATGGDTDVGLDLVSTGIYPVQVKNAAGSTAAFFSPAISAVKSPFVTNLVVTQISASSNVTYTATQVLGGLIARQAGSTQRSDTLPSASQFAALLGNPSVGDTIRFSVMNTVGGSSVNVGVGGSGTMVGGTSLLAGGRIGNFAITMTNVTSGNEAYNIYTLGLSQIL